jgi:hypothetical protein
MISKRRNLRMLEHGFERRWTLSRRSLAMATCIAALAFAGETKAYGATTITGTLASSKYMLTGSPVSVTTNAVLKISFETTTAGENLSLCAGTNADFAAGHCATQLNDSGGPGFMFLTIIDAASLNGKQLYVIRNVGVNPASFRFTIE